MIDFNDEQAQRKEWAEMLQKLGEKAIANNTNALARLASDIRKNRFPDFKAAGWTWG